MIKLKKYSLSLMACFVLMAPLAGCSTKKSSDSKSEELSVTEKVEIKLKKDQKAEGK